MLEEDLKLIRKNKTYVTMSYHVTIGILVLKITQNIHAYTREDPRNDYRITRVVTNFYDQYGALKKRLNSAKIRTRIMKNINPFRGTSRETEQNIID